MQNDESKFWPRQVFKKHFHRMYLNVSHSTQPVTEMTGRSELITGVQILLVRTVCARMRTCACVSAHPNFAHATCFGSTATGPPDGTQLWVQLVNGPATISCPGGKGAENKPPRGMETASPGPQVQTTTCGFWELGVLGKPSVCVLNSLAIKIFAGWS